MWGPTEFYATGNLLDFDVTDRLPELNIPVLLVTGEHDEARPETVAGFHRLIPNSRFEIIKGAGHASISRKPVEYRTMLTRFMEDAEK
jgi:pimeloyl-ACP methyl ester carboxylesterase